MSSGGGMFVQELFKLSGKLIQMGAYNKIATPDKSLMRKES